MTNPSSPAPSDEKARWLRVGRAVVGGFAGATVGWAGLGLFASGDFLPGAGLAHLAGVAVAVGVGAWLAIRARSRRARAALYILAASCVLFWVAAPAGWWAKPPPPMPGVPIAPAPP